MKHYNKVFFKKNLKVSPILSFFLAPSACIDKPNKAIEKKTPNKLAVERGCEFLQKT